MTRPTNPNITIPESFATEGRKTDFSNEKILNGFDPINPDVLCGDNLNKFIDDTYKGLNYSMDCIHDLYKGAVLYDSNETYNLNSLVFHVDSNNKTHLYRSLSNNNSSNSLTNSNYWQEIIIDASNFVSKTGDTMTGNLTIAKNSPILSLKDTRLDFATTPSTNLYSTFSRLLDANNVVLGEVQHEYKTDTSHAIFLQSRKSATENTTYSTIRVGWDANGNSYCSFPNTTCCDGQWVTSKNLLSNATAASTYTYDLSAILPNDGYKYEVMLGFYFYDTGDTCGSVFIESDIFLQNNTNQTTSASVNDNLARTFWFAQANTSTRCTSQVLTIPVGTGRYVKAKFTDANTHRVVTMAGYRRIGTNA